MTNEKADEATTGLDVVAALVGRMPTGRRPVLSDGTATSERATAQCPAGDDQQGTGVADFASFFDGLELIEPGVVPLPG